MNVKNVKISEIKAYDNNPRKNDGAVAPVAESIKRFGFKVPIIIDKNNVIVAGHTRIKAAAKLGMDEVPCVIADDLTDDEIKAFRLADNKVSEFAEWDFDELNEELANIEMDMSAFGFNIDEEIADNVDPTIGLTEKYELIIEFQNEMELEEAFDRFQAEGYQCRISTL